MTTANYAQTNVAGTSWKRASSVNISNPYNGQARVVIHEEIRTEMGDRALSQFSEALETTFDPNGSFPQIDPTTGEETGVTVTHEEIYVALHSLYIHLAKKRDEALKPVEETP